MRIGGYNIKVRPSWFSIACLATQALFLILRLCNAIDWPWVYVMIPLMVEGGLVTLDMVLLTICYIAWRKDKYNG